MYGIGDGIFVAGSPVCVSNSTLAVPGDTVAFTCSVTFCNDVTPVISFNQECSSQVSQSTKSSTCYQLADSVEFPLSCSANGIETQCPNITVVGG